MKDRIEAILAPFPGAGCEFDGRYWQVWTETQGGARVDGVSLAREIAERLSAKQARSKPMPAPVQRSPVNVGPADQTKRIAELEALLAAASAPKPEPVSAHIPPDDIADLIEIHETPPETHLRLTRLYAEAKQGAELARTYGGTFSGRSIVEWERKAERYESGIKWNRGRLAETI